MSKELPKEMLPIFVGSGPFLKPLLQALFEQLYDFGFREFCFIVGRGKRAIEDHFTPDLEYVDRLNHNGKSSLASNLEEFYQRIRDSNIIWINQPEPKGFGHAIFMGKPFIHDEPFLLCAGDTYIISKGRFLRNMFNTFSTSKTHGVMLLQQLKDPRMYGVAVVKKENATRYRILKVVEKPDKPPSNHAVMPFYIFKPELMDTLQNLKPSPGGEIQLTDAVQTLIDQGRHLYGVPLAKNELRLDVGTPETYWDALKRSHDHFTRNK
ncbi:MAG: hypothetical protein HY619_00955 [Thaumarchaeota archaeon]|nr:hypothetical protein [Nitrososphaerota archaeon]